MPSGMKKKPLLIFVIIVAIAVFAVCLSACVDGEDEGVTLKELKLVSYRDGVYVIGEEVDLNEIKFKAIYSDGREIEVTLDNSMLDADDGDKFFKEGTHAVTINYGGKQLNLQITVVAKSSVATYTARFFSNGGSEVDPMNTDEIKAFVPPTRDNYTFDGWYTSPDFSGDRAVSPFKLTKNTDFYAKWIDNRRCTVTFVDEDGAVVNEFKIVYGEGIDITDLEKYPSPGEKEGRIFTGWALLSGSSVEEITSDTVIRASYESVKCSVQITYWDAEGEKETTVPITYDYGEYFDVSRYAMPTKVGYTSRWVIYRGNSDEFEEFPTDTTQIRVTEPLRILANHEINTYSVTIYNGNTQQTKDNLKNGNVELTRVYADAASFRDYFVNYDTSFLLSSFIEEPNLTRPAEVSSGYDGQWCFAITTPTGEILRNADNMIWSEQENKFVLEEGAERTRNFILRDKDGNYIARVSDGNLYEIRGNVTIKAKYYKKQYTVTLRRRIGAGWAVIGSFTEDYLADFRLYDPSKYPDKDFASAAEVESYYFLNNVPDWTKNEGIAEKWQSVYFNGGNPDDWRVEWYSDSVMTDETKIDFAEKDGYIPSYEVENNLVLYCKDIDLRRYTVTLRYNYDFASEEYLNSYEYPEIKENDPITVPSDMNSSIIKTYEGNNNVTYVFEGWYDFPYEPDGSGQKGNYYASLETRNRNIVYYAHYKCETTYTLTIHDKTQREAYKDTPYDNKGYDVPENTVTYIVPAGTVVTADMLYKGILNANGTITSGQSVYEKAALIEYVIGKGGSKTDPKGELTVLYNALISAYGGDAGYSAAVNYIKAEIEERETKIENYEALLGKIYSYDKNLTEEIFLRDYLPLAEYNDIRREKQNCEYALEILESYNSKLELAKSYYDENGDNSIDGDGKYKRYTDSERDLNRAYGHDIFTDDYKYRFSGWYVDGNYSALYGDNRDMNFRWLACGGDLELYAKWADEEKGSEGLIFKKVVDASGNVIGVVVVDFMNKEDYENWAFTGCGYNDFDNFDYSVNYNDQDDMPISLGTNINIQIPAYHGGTNAAGYPVKGIAKGAFLRHGIDVSTVSLPKDIKFIEEGAFENCSLYTVSGESGEYLQIVDERAVYQLRAYDDGEYSVGANVLIIYAASSEGSKFVIQNGTVRVAESAFYGASNLKYAEFGNALVSIGDKAFENSGLTGSSEDSSVVKLPATLKEIGERAFKNCARISDFDLSANNVLCKVGREAVTSTGWYTSKRGVIVLNGLLVGVRGADETMFDKVGDDYKETVLSDGTVAYSYTNANGVLYYDKNKNKLTEISVTANIDGITEYALENLEGEVGVIRFAYNLSKYGIAQCAFKNCVNLEHLYLPDLSANVERNAFEGCAAVNVHYSGIKDGSWENLPNVILA